MTVTYQIVDRTFRARIEEINRVVFAVHAGGAVIGKVLYRNGTATPVQADGVELFDAESTSIMDAGRAVLEAWVWSLDRDAYEAAAV